MFSQNVYKWLIRHGVEYRTVVVGTHDDGRAIDQLQVEFGNDDTELMNKFFKYLARYGYTDELPICILPVGTIYEQKKSLRKDVIYG